MNIMSDFFHTIIQPDINPVYFIVLFVELQIVDKSATSQVI